MSVNDLADRLDALDMMVGLPDGDEQGLQDQADVRAAAALLREQADQLDALRNELDAAQLRSIEARNPGIDMDEVRASLAAAGGGVPWHADGTGDTR